MKPDLIELIRGRIGQDFDGECHLAEHEALAVIAALSEAAQEIERLREALGELVRLGSHGSGYVTAAWIEAHEDAKAALQPILPSGGEDSSSASPAGEGPIASPPAAQHSTGGG